MRYIGNKTRLLDFIQTTLSVHGIRPGVALDAFGGTASVGRFLKRQGFAVQCCDVMTFSHVLQQAYVQIDAMPNFSRLVDALGISGSSDAKSGDGTPQSLLAQSGGAGDSDTHIDSVIRHLNHDLAPRRSLISAEFSAASDAYSGGRMYFTRENAGRIDAIRESLDDWRSGELIDDAEFIVLLAALIEALDAVANTTGVYAAWVKSWQPNAVKPITLKLPDLTTDTGLQCRAYRGDVNELVRNIRNVDLLYLDPPYNARQYSSYYHIPELVALGWGDGPPELRGKTGLIPDSGKRSAYSRKGKCVEALNDLLEHTDARHVLMSYNSEGIIPEDEIERAFLSRGVPGSYRVHERNYARYRSDRDSPDRSYKGDRVTEKMYFVELLPN